MLVNWRGRRGFVSGGRLVSVAGWLTGGDPQSRFV